MRILSDDAVCYTGVCAVFVEGAEAADGVGRGLIDL